MNLDELYITHPGVGRTFHVFDPDNDHRSLCGRYMMLRHSPERCDPVKEDTAWQKGQDCKACFRKIGRVEEG